MHFEKILFLISMINNDISNCFYKITPLESQNVHWRYQ